MRILHATYVFLMCLGMCGSTMLVVLSFLANLLTTSGAEIVAVCSMCIVLIPGAMANNHFMASLHGISLQEGSSPEAGTFANLALHVGLSSAHMVLAIRWSTLLPIGVFAFFVHTSVSFTIGEDIRVALFNSGMLVLLICLLSIGKRRLEVAERRFFSMVVSERVLRARAESQLALPSTPRQSAPS